MPDVSINFGDDLSFGLNFDYICTISWIFRSIYRPHHFYFIHVDEHSKWLHSKVKVWLCWNHSTEIGWYVEIIQSYTLRVQVDGNDFAIMFLIAAPSSLSVAQRPLCFPEVGHKSKIRVLGSGATRAKLVLKPFYSGRSKWCVETGLVKTYIPDFTIDVSYLDLWTITRSQSI